MNQVGIKLFTWAMERFPRGSGGEYISTAEDGYFPSNLYNLTVALGMRDDRHMVEVMLNSRGDRPFHSMDEVSAGMYAFHRYGSAHTGPVRGPHLLPLRAHHPRGGDAGKRSLRSSCTSTPRRACFIMAGIPTILRWVHGVPLLDFQYLLPVTLRHGTGTGGSRFRAGPEFAWRQRTFSSPGGGQGRKALPGPQAGRAQAYRTGFFMWLSSLFSAAISTTRALHRREIRRRERRAEAENGLAFNAEAKAAF